MEQDHWFVKQEDRIHPIAIHWKGKTLQTIPLVLSALWVATLLMKFLPNVQISSAVSCTAFAFFSAAQGVKYYFYHEKTKGSVQD